MHNLSMSQAINLSISAPEEENKLAYKNKRHVCGELIFFCFSTLNLKHFTYLSLPKSVCD